MAQIDGILTPIAVAHKKEVKLYIGDLEKCKKPYKPLLLPIVEEYECDGKTPQRVIGAPRAFSSGVYQYYPFFLRGVEDWLYKEQKRYISHNQADLLYKYYVQDDSARSLLSVPIESIYEQVDENNTVIEERSTNLVMNIYAGHEKLLRGNPSVFLSLAQPMLDTISYALDSWMLELEAENDDSTSLYRIIEQRMRRDNMSKTNDNQKTVMVIRQDGTHSLKVITNSKSAKRGTRSRLRKSHLTR